MGARVGVRGLTKVYRDPRRGEEVVAIRDLNLEIEPDEFVCIVGQSGCGKTSFLHMLAGLRQQTHGQILVDGRAVTRPGADRGMVFQDYALFPWKTARANVELGPKIRKVPAAERRVITDHYLRIVGLEGFENRYPHELSGGMQQRVGIARALANQPPVLLMDEPFASVDALTRMNLQEAVDRIWSDQRTTVVFVTHSVDEAVFMADRVVVFTPRPGRVGRIFTVEIPRPRLWAALEPDRHFNELRREVLQMVRE
ncbi:MAG: ABC transporter ATP-binding protein [Candidatus Rokubacteria bacterium]|nr:ABC transporter ATP-binding protein [Candidatus Rokubacteria bacterium]